MRRHTGFDHELFVLCLNRPDRSTSFVCSCYRSPQYVPFASPGKFKGKTSSLYLAHRRKVKSYSIRDTPPDHVRVKPLSVPLRHTANALSETYSHDCELRVLIGNIRPGFCLFTICTTTAMKDLVSSKANSVGNEMLRTRVARPSESPAESPSVFFCRSLPEKIFKGHCALSAQALCTCNWTPRCSRQFKLLAKLS